MTKMVHRYSVGDRVWCINDNHDWLELRRIADAEISIKFGEIIVTYFLEVPGSSGNPIKRTEDEILPKDAKQAAIEALILVLEQDRADLIKKTDELGRLINSVRKGRRCLEFP